MHFRNPPNQDSRGSSKGIRKAESTESLFLTYLYPCFATTFSGSSERNAENTRNGWREKMAAPACSGEMKVSTSTVAALFSKWPWQARESLQ